MGAVNGDAFRAEVERLGLTTSCAARRCGVSPRTLARWRLPGVDVPFGMVERLGSLTPPRRVVEVPAWARPGRKGRALWRNVVVLHGSGVFNGDEPNSC